MKDKKEMEIAADMARQVSCDQGTAVPGMSYEEGVAAALDWASGVSDEHPIEE